MKRISLFIITLCALTIISCKPSRTEQLDTIQRCEDSLKAEGFFASNDLAARMADHYFEFAKNFPGDSLSPMFLYRASDLYMNTSNFDKSLNCLDMIIKNYSEFPDLPICYYMRGQTYEYMHKVDEAVEAYKLFIEKYPDHPLVESTQKALPYVGMDPEQMLEQILMDASALEGSVE